jgi:hypothetical protein
LEHLPAARVVRVLFARSKSSGWPSGSSRCHKGSCGGEEGEGVDDPHGGSCVCAVRSDRKVKIIVGVGDEPHHS